MVEPSAGVVVAGRVARRDVVRDVQTARNLVEDLVLELPVGRDGLLRIDLRHFPAARHGEEHIAFELDGVHRLDRIRLAVRRSVGVENAREICCRLRSTHDGQCEPPQVREERQCRRNLRYAPMLFGTILPEVVDHVFGLHGHRVGSEVVRSSGVRFQHLVGLGVAKGIERDAVHRLVIVLEFVIRNPVGFDELEIELHVRFEIRILSEEHERLAVLTPCHADGAELRGEVNLLRPDGEVVFDLVVDLLRIEEHLQPRSRAYRVVRQGRDDPTGVGVVLHLVAGACAERLAHRRIGLGIGGEELRRRPVAGVVFRGLCRVEAGLDPLGNAEDGADNGRFLAKPLHSTAPPDFILVMRKGHFRPLVACLLAK